MSPTLMPTAFVLGAKLWVAALVCAGGGVSINIVGKVREHLISIISNGKLAAAELRAIAQTAEPPRRWENVQ